MRYGIQIGIGILCSGLIGLVAYRRGSLTRSGVAGAVIVGTATFGLGGWVWGSLLIAFFILASLLSHYRTADKMRVALSFAKGGRRDLGQALANGGVGALTAVAYPFYPVPALWAAFVGAMAAVSADTWATELGVLSARPPRLVTTWQRVEAGTSGGVSLLGTLASLGGALSIGVTACVLVALNGVLGGRSNVLLGSDGVLGGLLLVLSAAAGGVAGSLVDSLLGATVQAMYYSHARGKETEKQVDPDGTSNEHVRGWRWMGNDTVNLLSSAVGVLVGAPVWRWLA